MNVSLLFIILIYWCESELIQMIFPFIPHICPTSIAKSKGNSDIYWICESELIQMNFSSSPIFVLHDRLHQLPSQKVILRNQNFQSLLDNRYLWNNEYHWIANMSFNNWLQYDIRATTSVTEWRVSPSVAVHVLKKHQTTINCTRCTTDDYYKQY